MRKVLVALGVALLVSGCTLVVPTGRARRTPPASRVRLNPPPDERPGRVIAALRDGFPPSLIRDLDVLVRDGEVPRELVMQAKAHHARNKVRSLISQVRSGTRDPRSGDPQILAALQSGLTTAEAVDTAWREGCRERARALIESLRLPEDPKLSDLHVFDPTTNPDKIEALLADAGWAVESIADAVRAWKDRRAGFALVSLHLGSYVPRWIEHLDWGLDRGLFSDDHVVTALAAADRAETDEDHFPDPSGDTWKMPIGRFANSWHLSRSLRAQVAHLGR